MASAINVVALVALVMVTWAELNNERTSSNTGDVVTSSGFYGIAAAAATADSVIQRQVLRTDGNVTFGGLFSIHERGESGQLCGNIKDDVGIQRVEAMLFAVDRINRHQKLLPGLRVGVHILDTCSRDTYALEQSVDFIRGRITKVEIGDDFVCGNLSQPPTRQLVPPVAGVIGASASTDSIMVASILRLFKIPQISYASTAVELSDKSRYEYFSRVVAPDIYQIKAMVEIVKKIGWSYVCTVGDEGWYGEKGIAEFEKEALPHGICVAKAMKVPRDANDTVFTAIVEEIKNQIDRAKVVVVFLSEENVRSLLRAVIRAHLEHEVQWLASDSWGAKKLPVKDNDMAAEYAITLLPTRANVAEFNDYFTDLRPQRNTRNPWFRKFWNHYFNCSLNSANEAERAVCESKSLDRDFRQEGLVHKTIDGVYALTHAIGDMCKAYCKSLGPNCTQPWQITPANCPHLFPPNGTTLLRYIRNVSFIGISGTAVEFNENGDSRARYDIFQYQRRPDGSFDYVTVGEWKQSSNARVPSLKLNRPAMRWPKTGLPLSRCSEPCKRGERTTRQSIEQCCWVCIACMPFEVLVNDSTCVLCPFGQKPDVNKTTCVMLPELSIEWNSVWALVPVCVSAFGILLTFCVLYAFMRHQHVAVIKASGRELCLVMLIGVLLCYAMTFVILASPSALSCAVYRFGTGISLSLIYAAIFTKTNRLSRIFNRSVKVMMKRPSYTSPRSQVGICAFLVFIQIIGDSMWLAMDIPKTERYYPDHREFVVLKCQLDNVALAVGFLYNLILVVLCTIFAFKVRNVPENFNETKYIAFAMYANCVLWLGFFAIHFGTRDNFNVQLTSTCLTLSITATTILACMFMPKFYVIFMHPEKNRRKPSVRVTLTEGSSNREHTSDYCLAPNISAIEQNSPGSIAMLITKSERPSRRSSSSDSPRNSCGSVGSNQGANEHEVWLRRGARINDYLPRAQAAPSKKARIAQLNNVAEEQNSTGNTRALSRAHYRASEKVRSRSQPHTSRSLRGYSSSKSVLKEPHNLVPSGSARIHY